ncbi:MCE family protein [Gordonia sp. TBRC 11910]|uniref:MCE family protein n=1 Tax=Gordonia asplenii TaxID=2725283 RepID=A0A848KZZ7_9ACTN|nr:MlaD family protein [Gordonia asplenii]NMO03747.1 MCE family protein [Gordonia asplenii]
MITKTRVSVLAMVVLAALSITYILNVGLHVRTPNSRTASMVVPDTNGILVGSRVLLRGIEIGHVTGIDQTVDGAEISWDYNGDTAIPQDSIFRVDNLSALGEAYVAVMPETSSGPFLADNARIDAKRVLVPTTFKELSQRLTVMLRQVDPTKVRRIMSNVNDGLPDGTEVLGNLNRAGTLLSNELTTQSDAFVTLLSALQPLIMKTGNVPAQLSAVTPLIPRFGKEFNVTLQSVVDVTLFSEHLERGIRDGAGPLFVQLQDFLDANSKDLNTIGVNLLPAARAGAAALRTVDIGRVLDTFLAATKTKGALTVAVPTGGR